MLEGEVQAATHAANALGPHGTSQEVHSESRIWMPAFVACATPSAPHSRYSNLALWSPGDPPLVVNGPMSAQPEIDSLLSN